MLRPLIFIVIITLTSCSPKLAGTTYTGSNQYKHSSIKFFNDTLCEIQQRILCKNIDTQYQQKTILATYKKVRFTSVGYKSNGPVITGPKKRIRFIGIVVNNVNCDNCDKYISVPNFFKNGCMVEKDSIIEKIGGFGKLYNFPNDTLPLYKGIIYIGTVKATPISSKE